MKRRRRRDAGSVLLDVMVALLIASTSLLILLGGIALSARSAVRARERLVELIAARNEIAQRQNQPYFQDSGRQ